MRRACADVLSRRTAKIAGPSAQRGQYRRAIPVGACRRQRAPIFNAHNFQGIAGAASHCGRGTDGRGRSSGEGFPLSNSRSVKNEWVNDDTIVVPKRRDRVVTRATFGAFGLTWRQSSELLFRPSPTQANSHCSLSQRTPVDRSRPSDAGHRTSTEGCPQGLPRGYGLHPTAPPRTASPPLDFLLDRA